MDVTDLDAGLHTWLGSMMLLMSLPCVCAISCHLSAWKAHCDMTAGLLGPKISNLMLFEGSWRCLQYLPVTPLRQDAFAPALSLSLSNSTAFSHQIYKVSSSISDQSAWCKFLKPHAVLVQSDHLTISYRDVLALSYSLAAQGTA
jgi:hypothetical protein